MRRTLALALALAATPAAAVVGGTDADGAAGGAVMVLSRRGPCTGIVLAPSVVLTAAHCATGGEHRVHWREGGEPVLAPVSAVAVHPGYDSGAVAGRRRSIDLALMRTAAPLPTRFAAVRLSGATAVAGDALTLGGYGVARPGDGRSSGTYRTATLPVVEPYGRGKILVWLEGRGVGACEGDSGGPVATAAGAVVAVTGWARGETAKGGGCGGLTQGVLVGPQRDWIDATLARWGARARWE